jgi:hypothetical protein
MQTRRHSAIEAGFSTFIGYVVAVIATQAILPLFGYPVRIGDNLVISGFFTIISLVRSYAVRRLFNWWGSRV